MNTQNFSAVLLNLDRDTARFDHMAKQLARAKINFIRQSGILGDDVPDDLRSHFFDASGHAKTTMKRGEIGCYASHLRALKRIASGELGPVVLVMEDDLDIDPDLIDILEMTHHLIPKDWDILRLSSAPRRAYVTLAFIGNHYRLVRYSKIPNSAGAYVITPRGAEKFLKAGIRGLTYDDDLRRPWFHGLNTFGIVPPPIRAGVLKSTIDDIEAGRFDKGMSSRKERMVRGDHLYALKRLAYNVKNLGVMNWILCNTLNMLDMLIRPLTRKSLIHRSAWLFYPKPSKN